MEEQDGSKSLESKFQQGVLDGLRDALLQTENDFLEMVENEMDERPDLVMVGSCVLVALIYGQNLYTLNLGDSRAVLATHKSRDQPTGAQPAAGAPLMALQLTELHGINVAVERERVVREHPDDPFVITGGRLKGKLRVTRAVGAGYLKKVSLVHRYLNLVTVCFALLNLPHE
jgi:pyruvate dehydrogenase phosphatase